jgi:hypothetical protein
MTAHEALTRTTSANPAAPKDRTPSLVRCEECPRNAFSYPDWTKSTIRESIAAVRCTTE